MREGKKTPSPQNRITTGAAPGGLLDVVPGGVAACFRASEAVPEVGGFWA